MATASRTIDDVITLSFSGHVIRAEQGDTVDNIRLEGVQILGRDVTACLPSAVLHDLSGLQPDGEDFK